MANLNETDQWEEGVYQLEENDPVLGGPGGIDNRAPRQLANRTRFQRLRSIAPWAETLPYPIGAYVAHAGFTWKSVVASVGAAPGTDAKKWARWGQTAAELQEIVDAAVVAHETKPDPHPQYTTDVDFAAHFPAQNPHSQYATDADLSLHQSATDPHEQYALRSGEDVVPKLFRGIVITVLKPHLRQMVWDGAAYVRAPWHQPAMVLYSYDNPSSIPGFLTCGRWCRHRLLNARKTGSIHPLKNRSNLARVAPSVVSIPAASYARFPDGCCAFCEFERQGKYEN